MLLRQYHRLISQIAIVAIIFASLAPSISHAMASAQQPWQQICSAQGTKYLNDATDKQPSTPSDSAKHHFEHCPYCANHIGTQVLPSVEFQFFLQKLNAVSAIPQYSAPLLHWYVLDNHPAQAPPPFNF
jgi:Protein of unknown function (DUF2946)